jgi:hypothetical protein
MSLTDKVAIVTGGNRGINRGRKHAGVGVCRPGIGDRARGAVMDEGRRIFRLAEIAAAVSLCIMMLAATPPNGALAATVAGDKTTASPKVRALMTSLAEAWLKEQGVARR